MYAVMVRCLKHWFVPYEPKPFDDQQCIYTTSKRAEEMAEILRTKGDGTKKAYEEVRIVKA